MPPHAQTPGKLSHDASQAAGITLENEYLRIVLDAQDGSIREVENKSCGLQLLRFPTGGPAWRVELDAQERWIEESSSFSWSSSTDGSDVTVVSLHWETGAGITVEGRVELPHDDPHARFAIDVRAGADQLVDKVEYPILRGIGELNDAVDSYLAHPQGTGFLFRRPYHLFEPEVIRRQGLRYSPYPEGFNGSTMQFMAYYAQGKGGFYLAADDPTPAMKWLNFFKSVDGHLESSFIHQSPDIRAGTGLRVPYPVLIGALFEGNWYEAAERYKAWAARQSWTARGPLWRRPEAERCGWLLDEVGFCTFGINAAHDRATWLDRFHTITGQPVFHVLGVNWSKVAGSYGRGIPGGREDWFPAQFREENLQTIRRNGDYWAPFEFDLLLDPNGTDGETISDALLQLPAEKLSFDQYRFPFVCPATDYLPDFHRWRDEQLAGTYDADALYYDISANNVLMTCRASHHGHPIGGGRWMTDAYTRMYAATKAAAIAAKGTYVPQGAEMISEAFIPFLDFYQARAEASPLSAFEADFFRDWIRQGDAEKIPLFAYVYHEYGPVRLDGWGKLSQEVGELFYWVASRVTLWGGLFELNYEFSPLESLDGQEDDPADHYFAFDPRSYEVDPAKVDFVREVALARIGFARPYLVYGMMARPLDVQPAEIQLDYRLYNVNQDRPHYEETGIMRVPSVVHAAWRAPDGRLGFLFVNLQQKERQTLAIKVDPVHYGIPTGVVCEITRITATNKEPVAKTDGASTIPLTLEPRQITLVEVTPITDGHRDC